MIHLDTSFLVRALAAGSVEEAYIREWLSAGTPVRVSSVSWAEFLCGPLDDAHVDLAAQAFGDPVAFTGEDGARSARLFHLTGRRRGSLMDCMIAAVAIRCDAALATSNDTDFRRFESAGLTIVSTRTNGR
ncbi:MAG: type II toxin-antitoxin system VapC family toxin [Acidimicrobiia bacterium]|nr:type II toxin-antitoxin system VapC family toxin [Acidimicrobiia bacterium]